MLQAQNRLARISSVQAEFQNFFTVRSFGEVRRGATATRRANAASRRRGEFG
jgi:hypothetical protein